MTDVWDETLILCNYSEKYKKAVEEYFDEFSRNGENAREDAFTGFSYTFLYIRESDGTLLGMLNIRKDDKDETIAKLGNIGYAIRPSERKKGYGLRLLEEGCGICKMLGIEPAPAVFKDNIAGIRLLLAGGFVPCENDEGSEEILHFRKK